MPKALSPIERRIYNYLVDYLKRETYQPSIREIGSRFGIRSTKTVTEYLQSLQRKGYLDRTPSRSRALKILGLDLSPETYTIPVYQDPAPEGWNEAEVQYDLDRNLACLEHPPDHTRALRSSRLPDGVPLSRRARARREDAAP